MPGLQGTLQRNWGSARLSLSVAKKFLCKRCPCLFLFFNISFLAACAGDEILSALQLASTCMHGRYPLTELGNTSGSTLPHLNHERGRSLDLRLESYNKKINISMKPGLN